MLQGGNVVADRVSEFVGRHMPMAVGVDVVAPPRHDQPALFEEFGLVDIRGTHTVAFLVAHLSFDGSVGP